MLEPLTTNEDLTPSGSKTWSYAWLSYQVHKIVTDGLPSFRPILSAIGTPTYTIKDSFAFAEELQSFDSKIVMASSHVDHSLPTFLCKKQLTSGLKIYLKIGLILIICQKTLSVSCLLGPCLNGVAMG